MLVLSPFRSNKDGNNREGEIMEANFSIGEDDFGHFSGGNLLDTIDFDDLMLGMHHDDDILPDLEMDPELLAEFSINGGDESEVHNSVENSPNYEANVILLVDENESNNGVKRREAIIDEDNKDCLMNRLPREKDNLESESTTTTVNSSFKERDKGKKSSSHSKPSGSNNSNNQGKRKAKVDWTPELHKRFVQAVEQLGVDKAVPSRILELMGIDCLTRHNIASHLQKYRSHRKHLLAREVEAASWTQKRQMYGVAVGGGKGGGAANIRPWQPPTMGFPPMTSPMHHAFRPLHVWGHPTMDPPSRLPMWPKQLASAPRHPPPAWTPPPPHPPPVDLSFWHSPHQRIPNAMTPAAPRFPQPLPATRFGALSMPGIPPHAMYRPEHGVPQPLTSPQSRPQPPFDFHPSKESIDAAIGDVLAKPYLPLPIGLRPPSIDSVIVELQRQGISKIPPSSA